MATDESLQWQQDQRQASGEALQYDLRQAAQEALRLERPLTSDEFESFRVDRVATATPIRRLAYVEGKLAAV
ncbi:MAG: hypothetical protein LBR32_04060 [Propionibacteriaceae bacterium]|jgi:hypothetical protein|nr:hypothetical protein [Propionibacteriaceae bacterium]